MKRSFCSFLFILTIILISFCPAASAASYPAAGQLAVGSRGAFFVVAPNHDLVGWGSNYDGVLNSSSDAIPDLEYGQRIVLMKNVSAVWSSNYTTIALDTDGTLYGWGGDTFHVLWNRPQGETGSVRLMENVSTASFNEFGGAVLRKDGSVWMWGDNGLGQLGLGQTDHEYHNPVQVMDQAAFIYAEGATTFVIKADGALYAWGDGMAKVPTYVAGNIASANFMKGNTDRTYQLLTRDGEILPYVVGPEGTSSGGTVLPAVENGVRAVVNGGFIKDDDSLWGWGTTDGANTEQPIKLLGNVASVGGRYKNGDSLLVVDTSNKLHVMCYGDEGTTTEVHSMVTLLPLSMRQIIMLTALIAAVTVTGIIIIVRLVRKRNQQQ